MGGSNKPESEVPGLGPLVLQLVFHSPRAGNSRVDCRLDQPLLTGWDLVPCCKVQGGVRAPKMVPQSYLLEPSAFLSLGSKGRKFLGALGSCRPSPFSRSGICLDYKSHPTPIPGL